MKLLKKLANDAIKPAVKRAKSNALEGKATTAIGAALGIAATLGFVNPIIPAVAGALALIFGVGSKKDDAK